MSTSQVDWRTRTFSSKVELNMLRNGLSLPAEKNTAVNRIHTRIPTLLKDPLLSLYVDSRYRLGDLVLDERVTLEELTGVIGAGRTGSGVFDTTGQILRLDHKLSLNSVGALFIKHREPSPPSSPIDRVATRAYTGILIDARGVLPVHGEYTGGRASPCIFPRIWDDTMELFYERSMMNPQKALASGVVRYSYSDDEDEYIDRIGQDPLRVTARELYGKNRTDPVIARADALKVLSSPENRALLEAGRIVILLDKDEIAHGVSFPEKEDGYYERFGKLKEYIVDQKIPDLTARDGPRGVEVLIQNLNFLADTANLLPQENVRLTLIAEMVRQFIADRDYTVRVEGHSAQVGRPEGEMELSVERARAIADALAERGIPREVFVLQGYGSTLPVAENTTEEGRAKNRRVEIIVMPRTTYIQRMWE
jgi:outer membrane protein OmpA-like peptidoglycan-associated protein